MGKVDDRSKFLKVHYPKGSKAFSYGFFNTTEGQEYLKVIKDNGYKLSCICNGEAHEIPMYVSEYINSYIIKNYRNSEANKTKHIQSCPRVGEEVESINQVALKQIDTSVEVITDSEGLKYPNFNAVDYIDKTDKKSKEEYIPNKYASLSKIGEVLLCLSWENYTFKEGRLPKEGNLFFALYKDIVSKSKVNEINLTDIMFIPNYKKTENEEITDITDIVNYPHL
jgi:hypothetical protein